MYECVCVRACVPACVRSCVRACVRAFVRACVRACMQWQTQWRIQPRPLNSKNRGHPRRLCDCFVIIAHILISLKVIRLPEDSRGVEDGACRFRS